jgi:hypothetical protein
VSSDPEQTEAESVHLGRRQPKAGSIRRVGDRRDASDGCSQGMKQPIGDRVEKKTEGIGNEAVT